MRLLAIAREYTGVMNQWFSSLTDMRGRSHGAPRTIPEESRDSSDDSPRYRDKTAAPRENPMPCKGERGNVARM